MQNIYIYIHVTTSQNKETRNTYSTLHRALRAGRAASLNGIAAPLCRAPGGTRRSQPNHGTGVRRQVAQDPLLDRTLDCRLLLSSHLSKFVGKLTITGKPFQVLGILLSRSRRCNSRNRRCCSRRCCSRQCRNRSRSRSCRHALAAAAVADALPADATVVADWQRVGRLLHKLRLLHVRFQTAA